MAHWLWKSGLVPWNQDLWVDETGFRFQKSFLIIWAVCRWSDCAGSAGERAEAARSRIWGIYREDIAHSRVDQMAFKATVIPGIWHF